MKGELDTVQKSIQAELFFESVDKKGSMKTIVPSIIQAPIRTHIKDKPRARLIEIEKEQSVLSPDKPFLADIQITYKQGEPEYYLILELYD